MVSISAHGIIASQMSSYLKLIVSLSVQPWHGAEKQWYVVLTQLDDNLLVGRYRGLPSHAVSDHLQHVAITHKSNQLRVRVTVFFLDQNNT